MYAVFRFRNFSLQSVLRTERFKAKTPVAILQQAGQQSTIYQPNSFAEAYGVLPAQTVAQALAKCPHLVVRPQKPLAENSSRKALFSCLYSLTPLIEETSEDTYTLNLSGIPDQEQQFRIDSWIKKLKFLGFSPKVGVASSWNWANFASSFAETTIWVQNPESFLNEIAIEIAVTDPKILQILKNWGIHTLGAFASIPKTSIAKRLGAQGVSLWESIKYPQSRILKIKPPPQDFESIMEFEHEIECLDPLLFVVHRMIEQLCLQLKGAFLQVKVLMLTLSLEDKSHYQRNFKLPEPTTDAKKLLKLLHTHLENLQLDASITAVTLKALPVKAQTQQGQLFQHHVQDNWKFSSTIHQLIGLVGSENVGNPKLSDSHHPDSLTMEALQPLSVQEDALETRQLLRGSLHLQRFRPPTQSKVTLKNGIPHSLSEKGVEKSILTSRGPWISSGQWWDQNHWKRLEWDVETEDHCLYRLLYKDGKWFIDGAYG